MMAHQVQARLFLAVAREQQVALHARGLLFIPLLEILQVTLGDKFEPVELSGHLFDFILVQDVVNNHTSNFLHLIMITIKTNRGQTFAGWPRASGPVTGSRRFACATLRPPFLSSGVTSAYFRSGSGLPRTVTRTIASPSHSASASVSPALLGFKSLSSERLFDDLISP